MLTFTEKNMDNTPQPQSKAQALLEHLAALRKVLVVSAGAIAVAFFAVFSLAIDPLMEWITSPISARGIQIIYTAMSEALTTKFKVSLIAGVVLASPVVIWQIWGFIKPALYPHEKKAFRLLFFAALLLFLTGVVFCYFAVYMLAVDFFLVAGENLATPMLSIDKYVGFLFAFIVPFGVAFMLPVFIYITTPIGLEIQAETPAEIAVSICAELIDVRGDFTRRNQAKYLEQTNTDYYALDFLAESTEPRAFALVLSSVGSTPVKSGSLMGIDRLGKGYGTIGGGCSESEVMLKARRIIGTGKDCIIDIDMTNDVAEEEGMVCGGTMKVWLTDVSD